MESRECPIALAGAGAFERALRHGKGDRIDLCPLTARPTAMLAFMGEFFGHFARTTLIPDYLRDLVAEADSIWILGRYCRRCNLASDESIRSPQPRGLPAKPLRLLRKNGNSSALSDRASRPRPSTKSLSASESDWRPTNPTAPTTSATSPSPTTRLGDLLRALGQGEQAKTFYEKSLASQSDWRTDEPNRADYQRDLSVSYNKLGDLLSALGQGEQAKTFYEKSLRIRERLAANEPQPRRLPERPLRLL